VPLDGGKIAERALLFAVDFVREYGRSLLLRRVVGPALLLVVGPELYPLTREALRTEEAEARRYLAGVRKRLMDDADARVECMVKQGNPAEDIARTAEVLRPSDVIVGLR